MRFVWLPETASILASVALLYTLSSLLSVYDGRPVFEWKGITLNAVVSVLSTASKSALLYAMSQLISQWKWILFTRASRPLLDFERIAAASRGPMGSLVLIWRWRSIGYLYLGALVMLLSIAADPFTQQLIQYKQRTVLTDDTNTTVNRAGHFVKGSRSYKYSTERPFDLESVVVDADLSMQSAILYGLDRPIRNVDQQGSFNCATGNCSWDMFESLAVCNKCTDISGGIQRLSSNGSQFPEPSRSYNDAGTAFRLPSGLYIDHLDGDRPYQGQSLHGSIKLATLGTDNATRTTSTPELNTLIWSMAMLHANENSAHSLAVWPNYPVSAMECALYYCVKSYNITVTNGILRQDSREVAGITRDTGSWMVPEDYANAIFPEGYADVLTESQINSIAFDPFISTLPRSDLALIAPSSGARFQISPTAIDSISYHFQSMFAPEINTFNISSDGPSMLGRFNGYCERSKGEGSPCKPSVMQTLLSSTDLNATFTALAASMSNALRTGAEESFEGVPIAVTGKRGDTITYYRIAWPWICLHCLSVIVGAVFLGITICENRRHGRMVPLWKASSLAIVGYCDVVANILSGVKTVAEMWDKAGATRVLLADGVGMASPSQELLHLDNLEDISQPLSE